MRTRSLSATHARAQTSANFVGIPLPPRQVAVLDEVQMIGDAARGWSWTRALIGLPAKELHVCGDPAALPLLRALASDCGEALEEVPYRRLAPLIVQRDALRGLADVAPGAGRGGEGRRRANVLACRRLWRACEQRRRQRGLGALPTAGAASTPCARR